MKWQRENFKQTSKLLGFSISKVLAYEQRIGAFKTWWKIPKILKLKFSSLFGINVFFNVFTLI